MREPKAERAMQRPSTLAALYDTRATCGSCAHFEATNRLMGWCPYREAKRGFVHVSELRLVKGVNADVYGALAPHVCALPAGTRINVNTATPPVLMTLGIDTLEAAQRIWQEGHANYTSLDELAAIVPAIRTESRYYGVQSTYFRARADITLDGLPFTFYSLIERRLGAGADGGIRVLARTRGEDE